MKKLLYLILLLLVITSCGKKAADENLKIFKYNEAAGILTLDPIYAKDQPHIWACNQLFNSLVAFDDNMDIVPCVAKSWDISDDGRTYTFLLRDDVFFHNDSCFGGQSRRVVARDFEYSFNRLLDRKLSSPGTWIFAQVRQDKDGYAIRALNDSVFQIELKESFPAFLGILSMNYASVVPHEAVEFYGENFGRHPVGTGPFKFQYWKEGVRLVMRKNPEYFEFEDGERLPYLDAVSVSFLIDKQVAFMEFVKGKTDFMSGVDARYKDELLTRDGHLRSKYEDRFYLIREPYLNTEYLSFYIDTQEEKDDKERAVALRQAVNYSIDREKMLHYLRNGIGRPGNGGIIPAGLPGYDSLGAIGYAFNQQKSFELIDKYQLHGSEIKLYTTKDYIDLAKFVQSSVTDVGLVCKVEEMMPAALREKRAQCSLPFFRSSWVADYPDAENYLSLFTTENFAPKGPNYTHYSNRKYDRLYETAIATNDLHERAQIYHEMDSLMMTEAPVVILFYDEVLRFVNKRVSGFNGNPVNLLNLKTVRID
ncbi:MAG: ABC transporter substrate-binding protein [Bacteroidales bacterium]|jgi:peptide/nickel transport system substrate-binding protein|nr:ABC transporter substrate-binding protein [Bacteroidales bacterium]